MSVKPLILTVSNNNRNLKLLHQFLHREGYEAISVSNLEEFNGAINESIQINLGLIDITGFDNSIWKWCEQLLNQQIPFLIISPRQSDMIQHQSLVCGASNILIKPLVIRQLFSLITNLLRNLE